MSYRNSRISSSSISASRSVVPITASKPTTPVTPIDVIILQYEDCLVFVLRPETFKEATDISQKEFPQLAHFPPHRVGFALNDTARGNRPIRVSESAWMTFIGKVPAGTVINVIVLPDPDEKQPPMYAPTVPPKDNGHLSIRRTASNTSMRSNPKSKSNILSWIGVGK